MKGTAISAAITSVPLPHILILTDKHPFNKSPITKDISEVGPAYQEADNILVRKPLPLKCRNIESLPKGIVNRSVRPTLIIELLIYTAESKLSLLAIATSTLFSLHNSFQGIQIGPLCNHIDSPTKFEPPCIYSCVLSSTFNFV